VVNDDKSAIPNLPIEKSVVNRLSPLILDPRCQAQREYTKEAKAAASRMLGEKADAGAPKSSWSPCG